MQMNQVIEKDVVSYLSRILFECGRTDDLVFLASSPKWRKISNNYYPSKKQYIKDIQLAKLVILAQLHSTNVTDKENYSKWLLSFINLQYFFVNNSNPPNLFTKEMIAALSVLGNYQEAIDRAGLFQDEVEHAQALIFIGKYAEDKKISNQVFALALEILSNTGMYTFDEDINAIKNLVIECVKHKDSYLISESTKLFFLKYSVKEKSADGITSEAQYAYSEVLACTSTEQEITDYVSLIKDDSIRKNAILRASISRLAVDNSQRPALALDPAIENFSETGNAEVRRINFYLLAVSGEFEQGLKLSTGEGWRVRAQICHYGLLYGHRTKNAKDTAKCLSQLNSIITSAEISRTEKIDFFARLITGSPITEKVLFKSLWKDFYAESLKYLSDLDYSASGNLALAIALLDIPDTAQFVLAQGAQNQIIEPSWEEIYAVARLIEICLKENGLLPIKNLFPYIDRITNLWKKADLLIWLFRAGLAENDEEIVEYCNAEFEGMLGSKSDLEQFPNVMGSIVVWAHESNSSMYTGNELFERAIELLVDDEDGIDGLAYLSMTLCRHGLRNESVTAINKSVELLLTESDFNSIARIIGTITEVAVMLDNPDILVELINISENILDPWLKAEALFWISGAFAALKNNTEAANCFSEAVILGEWSADEAKMDIEFWAKPGVSDRLIKLLDFVGWPSTKVAAKFASIQIAMHNSNDISGYEIIKLLNQVITEYDSKLVFTYRSFVDTFRKVGNEKSGMLTLLLPILASEQLQSEEQIWALLAAWLPVIKAKLGNEIPLTLLNNLSSIGYKQ